MQDATAFVAVVDANNTRDSSTKEQLRIEVAIHSMVAERGYY
jgi:hypothetical protein